jgi:hypothetical protein
MASFQNKGFHLVLIALLIAINAINLAIIAQPLEKVKLAYCLPDGL